MKKVVKAFVFKTAAGITIATKFSNQSAVAEETKAQMLDICATDKISLFISCSRKIKTIMPTIKIVALVLIFFNNKLQNRVQN